MRGAKGKELFLNPALELGRKSMQTGTFRSYTSTRDTVYTGAGWNVVRLKVRGATSVGLSPVLTAVI